MEKLKPEPKKAKKRKLPEDFEKDVTEEFDAERTRVLGKETGGAYRKRLKADTTQEHRDLDRAAFVLEKLKGSRVCTAIGMEERDDGDGGAEKHMQLFANVPDAQMASDMRLLIDATKSKKKRKLVRDRLMTTPDGCRLKKTPENAEKRAAARKEHEVLMRRRGDKVMRLLKTQKLQANHVHVPFTSAAKPVHAEQQATQWAKDEQVKFTDMGISKLCCAKCWKALEAASTANIHPNLATGTHMKTYDTGNGWPAPEFLFGDDTALKSFLGEAAFAEFSKCDQACKNKCREFIEKEVLAVKGQRETDLVSSEDEFDFSDADDL